MGDAESGHNSLPGKYRTPQQPYIFLPPATGKGPFGRDELFCFGFILIGGFNRYLPYFLYAFEEMGRMGLGRERGQFTIVKVEVCDRDGQLSLIYSGRDNVLQHEYPFITFKDADVICSHELVLRFVTPLRIKLKGRLVSALPFALLAERLAELHCSDTGRWSAAAPGSPEGDRRPLPGLGQVTGECAWILPSVTF